MAALTGDIYQMLKNKASETQKQKAATDALSQINKTTTTQQSGATKKGQVDSILGGGEESNSPAQQRLADRGQNIAVTDTGTRADDTIDGVMGNLLNQQRLWLGDNYQWSKEEANTLRTILSTSSDPEDTASRYIAAKGYALNFGIDTETAYNNLDMISEYYTGAQYDAKSVSLAQRIKNGFVRNDAMSLKYEWMQADLAGNTERANELKAQIEEKEAYIGDNTSAIPVSRLDEIKSLVLENLGYIAQPAAEGGVASALVTAAGMAAAAAFPIASAPILGTTKTLSTAAASIFSGKKMYEWAAAERYYSLMNDEEYQSGRKSKGAAQLLSTVEGLVVAGVEIGLDGVTSRALGAVTGRKLDRIGISALVDLEKRGVTNTVTNAVMDWATGAVDEAVFNELPEYVWGEISSAIYKNVTGNPNTKEWTEYKNEAIESIKDGFIVGAVYGAVALPSAIKSDRKTALTLRRAANASSSLSEFIETTKDMKPETMSDEDFETARTQVYKASQEQKQEWREEAFKDTVLESEEISAQELFSTVNPETGEETAKALPDGKVYRTDDGELYSQTRTNNAQGTTEVFYGDPDSSALYGVVVLSSDGDTQTVQQVRVREGYESIRSEMVKNALRDTLSTETGVEWNPTTRGLQNVKNELISSNPDKTGLVYRSTVRGNDADIQSIKSRIKTANPNLSDAEATLAARLTSIADVGTNTIKYESASKLTTQQTGGKAASDFRGATDTAARTLIYVGQNSDASTFVHELFHAVSLVRTKEAQNLSTSIHNALQSEPEAAQLRAFISEHSQIWGKDADVDKIMSSLMSIGEGTSADKWTVSQHENLARLHEAYRSSSRSIQASLPKAIRAILEKLTQFMNRVYKTMKDITPLNEDIAKAYDSLMGIDEAAQKVESKGAEAEFKAYGDGSIDEDKGRVLYQEGGYNHQKNMSNRAVAAYDGGEMPLSKWTKAELDGAIKAQTSSKEVADILTALPVEGKKAILNRSSWHHTGIFYNATDFYEMPDLSDVTVEQAENFANRYREYKADEKAYNKAKKESLNNLKENQRLSETYHNGGTRVTVTTYGNAFEGANIPDDIKTFAEQGLSYSRSGNAYIRGMKPTSDIVAEGLRRLELRDEGKTVALTEYSKKAESYETVSELKLSNPISSIEDLHNYLNGTYAGSVISAEYSTETKPYYLDSIHNILYQDSLIDDLSGLNDISTEDTDAINEQIQQIMDADPESERQAAIDAEYLKSHDVNDEVFDSELPEGWEDNFESDYEDRLEREKELEDALSYYRTTEERIRDEENTEPVEGAVDHGPVVGAKNLDLDWRDYVNLNDPQIDYVTDADTDVKKDAVFREAIKDDTVLRRYLGILGGAYLYDTSYTNRGYEVERDSFGRMQEVHYTQPYKYDDAYRQSLHERLVPQLANRGLKNALIAAVTNGELSEAQLKTVRKELGDNARFYRNILALLMQDGSMLPKELVKEVKGLDIPAREEMDRMGITDLAELARKAGDEELRQKILSGRLKFGNDKDQKIYKQLTEYIKRADSEIKEKEKEITALDKKSKDFDEQKAQLEKAIDERTEIILDAEEVVNALTDTLITDENNSGRKYRTELAEKYAVLREKYNALSPAREREHQASETQRQLDHAVKDGSRMREKKTAGHAGWRQQERGAKYGTEAWVKEVAELYPDIKEQIEAEAAKDKRKSYASVGKDVIENAREGIKKELDNLRVEMTGSAAKALSLNASKITRNLESIKALADGTGVVILKDYLEEIQAQTKDLTEQLAEMEKEAKSLGDELYSAVTRERWKAAKAKHEAELKQAQKEADTKFLHEKEVSDLKEKHDSELDEAVTWERWKAAKAKHEAELKQIQKDIDNAYIVKQKFAEQKAQHEEDIKTLKAEQREKERQRRQYQAIRDEKQRIANAIVRPVNLNTVDYSRARQIEAIQALVDPEFRREWIYDLSVDPTQTQTHIPTMTIEQAKSYLAGLSEEERRNLYAAMPEDLMYRLTETRRPLNDYTIAELQDIATAVEELRAEGRAILQAKKDARNRLATAYQRSILNALGTLEDRDTVLPEALEGEKEKRSWKRIYRGIMFSTRRMQELAQLLDGGYGNKGAAYRLLVEEKRFHQDNEARATERRYTRVGKYLTDENVEQMTQQVKVDFGVFENSFTIDQLAYVWLSQDNEQNKAAVMYGSLLTPGEKGTLKKKGTDVDVLTGREQITREWLVERAELIEDDAELEAVATDRYNKLLETAKKELTDRNLWDLVNAIRDDFNDPSNAQRLNATSIEVTNTPLTTLDNYLPIRRTQQTGEDTDSRASNAIFNFAGNSLDYNPEKGFTIDRIRISPRNQAPVDLSLLGVWQQAVKNEEHFIEFAGYVTKLRKVFESHGTGEVRREMQRKWTTALYKEVKTYIDVVANPDISTSNHVTDSFFRTIRGKTGSAYLGWKASGVILQAITSPASAFSELKPWEVFAAYGTLGAHPIETVEFINNKSSFMKNRTMNPIIDEAIQRRNQWGLNKAQRAYNKFEEVGQMGLTLVDRYAVAGPWLAMYQRQLKEGLAMDMTTEAAETRAIRKADEFIMRTQPVGDKTEIASMFRDSPEALKTLLQFQTSLNVVWNNLTANVVGYVKNKQVARLIGTLVGYGVAGILLGLVQTGFDDDDDAVDVARKLSYWSVSQFTGAIPYASLLSLDSVAKYLMTGDYDFYMTNGTSVSPIQDKLLQGMLALGGGKPLKSLGKLSEAAGLMTGLPVSGFKEAVEAVQQKSLAPLVGRE